jgi:nucleotide-binding universal stress UspA family protein
MIRDIVVHIGGSTSDRRLAELAIWLAEKTGARLHGLHVIPLAEVPPVYKASLVEEVATEIAAELTRKASAAAKSFEKAVHASASMTSWSMATGDIVQGISDKARCADLVIVGQRERQGSPERHPLPISHAVVMRCGRPVLVVPSATEGLRLEKVVIAWDGSREAVRAVHDALTILRLATIVHIVTVSSHDAVDDGIDADELTSHLARHGITVQTPAITVKGVRELPALQAQIERERYDLLVMGAYSHPKWVEFIFGGTTRSLLSSSPIPVLVSH